MERNALSPTASNLDAMTRGYLVAALWTATDDEGMAIDPNLGLDDFHPQALFQAMNDCAAFAYGNAAHVAEFLETFDWDRLGHELWMTRNRHGTGFWDCYELRKDVATELTAASHRLKERYVGVDDGTVHID